MTSAVQEGEKEEIGELHMMYINYLTDESVLVNRQRRKRAKSQRKRRKSE
jgi:hypothetical protein